MKLLMSSLTVTALSAAPVLAASGPFFSLANTNFVVMIAFVLYVLLLWKLSVHKKVGTMLDDRAAGIQSDLDQARELREEAQSVLASYERKQKEVQVQADSIVASAKEEAKAAAAQAKDDLKASIARRLAAAEDQIVSAQNAAVKEVRDTAVSVASAAASDVISAKMTAKDAGGLIDAAIADVADKLH
jgi:F-type H+-transporting ATPase subunit b